MALEIRDRVKETCTGTDGDMTLTGAMSGFVGFDLDATLDGDTIYYALEDADGTKWEVGLGTLSADSTSIERTTILATQVSFTDTTRQTFSGGTHTIFATYPASKAVYLDASGNLSHTVDISSDTNLAAGTGITLTGDTLSTTDGEIVHDNLSGFVANEHIDWTTDQGATNIHSNNYVVGISVLSDLNDVVSPSDGSANNTILIATNGSTPSHGTLSLAAGNIGLGTDCLGSLTSGDYNVAIGYKTLKSLTSEAYNVGIGSHVMTDATSEKNVGIGHRAMFETTTADKCTIVGDEAGYYHTTGNNNTAIGYKALYGNPTNKVTGTANVAVGYLSVYQISSGSYNVGVGDSACGTGGTDGFTGSNNIGIGHGAGYSYIAGESNICMGYYAGFSSIDNGDYNIAIGYRALADKTSPSDMQENIAIGYEAGQLSDANRCIYIGTQEVGYANTTDDILFIGNDAPLSDGTLIKADLENKHLAIGMADDLFSNSAGDPTLQIYPKDAADEAIFVKMPTSHSSNLIQIQNSSGTDLFVVDSTGEITTGSISGGGGSGDITGVDLTGGVGISIDSETNTTSGAYSSTITCNLEGTELASTGETGTTKFLRVDGDGTCSWQVPPDTDTTYTKASFDIDHLFTLVGASADTDENLGTFTGSTIADSQTIKAAIQAVETAVETKGATAGSSSIVTVGTISSGTWQGTAIAQAYIANDAINGDKIADDAVNSEHYAAGSIDEEHLNATNSPTDNYLLSYDDASGGFTWVASGSGGENNEYSFKTISVAGQDDVVADTTTDTLTLAAGSNVTITTTAASDTVTIAATDTNTMGSGFTVSATTDSNATTITQGDDLMFAAGTGITCETTADGTVTISSTVTDTNTQLSQEQVEDFVGGMLGGTETLITVTYQDGTGDIDFVVDNDLSNYDNSSSGFITATLTEEQVEDFVGGMLGGTETGITVTYQDGTGDIDFVVSDTTVAGDSGSTGITPGDTLTIAGGTNVTTAMSGDTLTITATDTNTTYSAATSSALGLVKIEDDTEQSVAANAVSATASRTYGIQLNSSDQAVVNVPWTDTDNNTTYTGGTNLTLDGTTFNVDDAFLKNDASDSTTGTITAGGFTTAGTLTVDSVGISTIQSSGESFADNDTSLMTSAAIDDRINSAVANEDTLAELNDTNISSAAAGHLIIYDNTASVWDNAALTAGSNISITNGDGAITIAATDTNTTYTGGTNLTLAGTTFNVDDAFLINSGDDTTTGVITAGGFTTTGTWTFDEFTSGTVGITTVQDSGTTFDDNDTSLMTAAAIADKIEAYGYSTTAGDITGVTAGTGLSGGGASGAVTLNVDASQTQITAVGTIGTGVWQGTAIAHAYIGADAIDGDNIADDSVNSEHYVDGSIDTAHIADDQVTYAKVQNVSATSRVLGRITSGAGVIEELTGANIRTIANVEDGATADQTKSDIDGLAITTVGTIDTGVWQGTAIAHAYIGADAIDGDNIADDAVNSEHYVDGSIDTAHIADDQVTYAKIQNVSATDRILGRDSAGAGVIEEITPANLRTMLNVEDGATADQTKSDIDGLAITTVGTIDTGTWQATDVAVAHGGTGASSAADARSNLGITYANIGTVDISANTNLAAGTNISLSGDTLNVDDAFLKNDADDTTSGTVTMANLIVGDAGNIGSASDTDAIAIASDGEVSLSQRTTFSKAVKTPLKSNTDGSTITFNLDEANTHTVTLGDNRTLALSNSDAGQKFIINLVQDGTGSRTVTWFSTIKWAGGSAPTLTTTANKADSFGFLCTGTDAYYGFVIGQNI